MVGHPGRAMVAVVACGLVLLAAVREAAACSPSLPVCEDCGVRLLGALDGATVPPDVPIAVELRCVEADRLRLVTEQGEVVASAWVPFAPYGSDTGVVLRDGPPLPDTATVSLEFEGQIRCARFDPVESGLDPTDSELEPCAGTLGVELREPLPVSALATFRVDAATPAAVVAPVSVVCQRETDASYWVWAASEGGWSNVLAVHTGAGLYLAQLCADGSTALLQYGRSLRFFPNIPVVDPTLAELSYEIETFDLYGAVAEWTGAVIAAEDCVPDRPVNEFCTTGTAPLAPLAEFQDYTGTSTCRAAQAILEDEALEACYGSSSSDTGSSSTANAGAAGGTGSGSTAAVDATAGELSDARGSDAARAELTLGGGAGACTCRSVNGSGATGAGWAALGLVAVLVARRRRTRGRRQARSRDLGRLTRVRP